MINKIKIFIHRCRIYNYSKYSKYFRSEIRFNELCLKAYPGVPKTFNFYYNFRYNRITKNEVLIIYSDKPGLVCGYKGENIFALRDAYTSTNKHCKNVKMYEVSKVKF